MKGQRDKIRGKVLTQKIWENLAKAERLKENRETTGLSKENL